MRVVFAALVIGVATLFASCADSPGFTSNFSGFNGPIKPGLYIFESELDARESWVGKALDQSEFVAIISGVDFSRQRLVALAAGKRASVTGDMEVAAVDARPMRLDVSAIVPVSNRGCMSPNSVSYPFVIITVERLGSEIREQGFDISNASSPCLVEKSDQPSTSE